jgi:phage baseplate assembly protein V
MWTITTPKTLSAVVWLVRYKTNWLSIGHARMGLVKDWNPPSVGEQVVLLSPSGDLSQADHYCLT